MSLNSLSAFGVFSISVVHSSAILNFVKHRSHYVPFHFKNFSRDFSPSYTAFRIMSKLCSVIFKILRSLTKSFSACLTAVTPCSSCTWTVPVSLVSLFPSPPCCFTFAFATPLVLLNPAHMKSLLKDQNLLLSPSVSHGILYLCYCIVLHEIL